MGETLTRSSLGALRAQGQVNLELPLRVQDRLGGHVVQGHVDGTGTVRAIRDEGFARVLEIEAEPRLQRYLVEKGSVAIDGVSLTVSALPENGFAVSLFAVSLIPETLRRTNLGALHQGALVNIEVDILAKHLERLLEARA
jgi:riboflavin synthase